MYEPLPSTSDQISVTTRAIERQRANFRKNLHDGLAQEVMAAAMLSKVLSDRLDFERHASAQDARQVSELLSKVSDSLHKFIGGLSSPISAHDE
jgi:signal transduction histidine kinase